jgi:two-component system copper resistance phosphate regulon response regulator CusR
MRLLLVEDDAALAAVLVGGFAEHGIAVTHAATAAEGRDAMLGAMRDGRHDVIVLDVMLPGGSGFDLCRALRARGDATPLLMLTARDAVDDRVAGLEAGADDYLAKPFAFRELLARVRALVRRPSALARDVVRVADLEVDLAARRVRRGGRAVELTAKEWALLELFVRRPERVLGRAEITAYVWDDNHDPFTNVLEVLVRRLRRKIDDPFGRSSLETVRGVGYRLRSDERP